MFDLKSICDRIHMSESTYWDGWNMALSKQPPICETLEFYKNFRSGYLDSCFSNFDVCADSPESAYLLTVTQTSNADINHYNE